MAKQLYTIGYTGFENIDDFVEALHEYKIQRVIDVRSNPSYSTYYKNYEKKSLEKELTTQKNGIQYDSDFSKAFGAQQLEFSHVHGEPQENYRIGQNNVKRLDFNTFTKSDEFLDGVKRVKELPEDAIAFMCAEKRPWECHRAVMVGRALSLLGYEVKHILSTDVEDIQIDLEHGPNTLLISQKAIDQRLLEDYVPDQIDFFGNGDKSDEEKIIDAYARQNDEIGFHFDRLKEMVD